MQSRATLSKMLLAGVLAVVLAGCAGQRGFEAKAAPRLKVVATVAPITNMVQNVGGSHVDVIGIVPEGTDSHTFQPVPSDAKLLAEADLIIMNGLHLETPTEQMALANKKPDTPILHLGDDTVARKDWVFDFSFPESNGDPNPHLWLNVDHAMSYVRLIAAKLSELDPTHQGDYDRSSQTYLSQLAALDQGIAAAVRTIPDGQRKLLTYHDSWSYFAQRYGMTVIGAMQPADFSQPSAREVANMIDQIRREQVAAIFGSEVFPSKVLAQMASEAGAKYVDKLADDALPDSPGAPTHTYIGMMLANMRAMVPALGGNVDALAGIDPGNATNAAR